MSGRSWFTRGFHLYKWLRAILRGPRYTAGYAVRRGAKRAAARATRNWK